MATRIYHEACFASAQQSVGGPQGAPKKRPATWPTTCAFCHAPITKGSPITYVKGDAAPSTTEQPPVAPASAPEPAPIPAIPGDLGALLGALLSLPGRVQALESSKSSVDVDALVAQVLEQVEKPVTIEVRRAPDVEPVNVGVQHKEFPTLLQLLSIPGINVWLPGPAGSGKTSAAHKAADALGLKFSYIGAITDPYQLLGYNDANGKYVATPFYQAWREGGVFLFDDTDGSDPSALVALNAMLANGVAAFPCGMQERHPETRIVATANTWGHGATSDYVGRSKIDAATLDRFVFLAWDYDEVLERAMSGNERWAKRVQDVRSRVREQGIKVLVTPRATVFGARMLAAGMAQAQVEELCLRKGMTQEQWDKVRK